MGQKLSVRALTLCHAAMGAVLGAATYAAMVVSTRPDLASGRGVPVVLALVLPAWMAVGAGLSGFILVNIERAD